MRTKVSYEWVCEELTESPCEANGFDPEIIDCHFWETYREARAWSGTCDGPWRVALVRNEGNECEGAYVARYSYVRYESLTLQPAFETCADAQDGPRVPKRFQLEVEAHHLRVD